MSTEKSHSAADLDKVCIELDELVIKYFETVSELCDLKQQLEDIMKDGYIHMAKARYSMGARSVSCMQYDVKDIDVALVSVDVTSFSGQFIPQYTSSTAPTNSGKKSLANTHESLIASSDAGVDSDLSSAVSHLDINIGLGVRKRNVPCKGTESCEVLSTTGHRHDDQATIRDPIKWFGILSPRSLKQSQQAFKSGIEVACRLASLQSRLLDVRESYENLLQEKKHIEADSSVVAAVEN